MKSSALRNSIALVVAFTSLAMTGCHKAETDSEPSGDASTSTATQQLADDGAQVSAASAQSTQIDGLFYTPVTTATPEQAAIQASTATDLWPAACVTRSKTSATVVKITFDDCTGPFGLVHLNGAEIATFSAGSAPGALHVELASDGLTANGKAIDHHASADVTFKGAERDVAWKGNWTRTTDAGLEIDHQSDLALVIDTSSSCLSATGTASTTVDSRGIDSQIEGYEVCASAGGISTCPTGELVLTGEASGKQVTIDFDGSNRAEVTAPRISFSVPLVCGS